jgi:hypothetical protein
MDMESSTKSQKSGQVHVNMDEDTGTCMRTWKYGQGYGTSTKTWQHERGHDNIDEDMATWTVT